MAGRSSALTHVKMNRSRKILALVPKSGAISDDESSESSEEEVRAFKPRRRASCDSSPAPSLTSSLENINICSDSEDAEFREVVTVATVHHVNALNSPNLRNKTTPSTSMATVLAADSPASGISMIHSDSDIILPSPALYIAPSPSLSSVASPVTTTKPAKRVIRNVRTKTIKVIKKTILKQIKLTPKWANKKFTGVANIKNVIFDACDEVKSPLEYFKKFFSDDLIELIVEQSNLYSTQKTGASINITTEDIRDFLAINILMGIVEMPAYTDYWSKDFRYSYVADVMPLKKFQKIRRYLHFNDNMKDDGDRYYKVRPLIDIVRKNCLDVSEGNRFSIDEMMVPYKGTRAGSRRQYLKNKPKKWGFKIFVRAATSGFVHDLVLYGGEDTFRGYSFTDKENSMGLGAKTVIALASSIKNKPCSVLYFDNFFTSIELIHHLRYEYGIFSLGTIRQNRLRGAEKKLPTDKVLKKRGRGSFAQVVCNENKIAIVKWFDNKSVLAASSYVDAHPVQEIVRYKKEEKKRVPVKCPNLIKHYNINMGGVDLADMLIALYRTNLKGHRWYLPIFSQVLDICVNNAWLLYRREANNLHKLLTLKSFRFLLYKQLKSVGRSSGIDVPSDKIQKIKKPVAERVDDATRLDLIDHLPTFTTKGRCRNCTKHQTKYYCRKCDARLCIVEGRNCFTDFHTKY